MRQEGNARTEPIWRRRCGTSSHDAIHSFTASGALSLTNTGFSRPRSLRFTVLRANSTLAILALYFPAVHAVYPSGAVQSPYGYWPLRLGSRLTTTSTSTPSSRLSEREHVGAATRCKASDAAYPGPRMRFLTSTIPMPTSITSTSTMDSCDQSTHTHHRPEPRSHDYVALNDLRRDDRVQGTRPDEVSRRAPPGNGVMTASSMGDSLSTQLEWLDQVTGAGREHRSHIPTTSRCRHLTLRRLRRDSLTTA